MQVYLVGGAVRDHLLGHPYHEKDYVVVGASPNQMLNLGYQPVGKDFPVFLHPETKEEYALARTERKSGTGYHGFEFHTDTSVTLEQDLIRRDLTINAMAMDEAGHVHDPYNGQQDLADRVLRHVSDAFILCVYFRTNYKNVLYLSHAPGSGVIKTRRLPEMRNDSREKNSGYKTQSSSKTGSKAYP